MNNLVNWFTKKTIVIFSFSFTVIFSILYFINGFSSCRHDKYCSNLTELGVIYLLPFVSVFILSLVTFKAKEPTFKHWINFSVWTIPTILIIITLFPTRTHGMDFLPITKGIVSVFLVALYSIVSLFLIISKSLKKE